MFRASRGSRAFERDLRPVMVRLGGSGVGFWSRTPVDFSPGIVYGGSADGASALALNTVVLVEVSGASVT